MIGLAALAFASCAKHDFETMTQEQIVKAEYDAKFVDHFQQPASNHTWGFGSSTRAFTRGVFANGNEWAANDKEGCNYRVPPKLDADQTAVVIKYFQTHKNLGYENPKWTNYFIQQVYKGGTAPLEGYSPEQYEAANGTDHIIGSDKMNHLAAIDPDMEDPQTGEKPFVDHNNNFNHGDCGEGYPNVLDFKGTLTTVEETYSANSGMEHRHSDKINLMTNSTTKSFGYFNSDGAVRRTEYTGLVSYKTIMEAMGAEANCLDDGWNRSFMGFDFEMMVGPELFQDRYVKLSDIPGNAPQYIWDGDNVIKWYDVTYENWQPTYTFAEGYDEYIRIDGQLIPYLTTNKNEYAGTLLANNTEGLTNINQQNLKVYKDYSDDVKNVECLNLPLLRAAFEAKYYPTEDKAQTWVKVGGTADGYYSDWIVTLTEATKYDVDEPDDHPSTYSGRIMAEDLTAGVDVTGRKSDWDFNDVVFDWAISTDGKKAYVKLLAAGGELPLRIGGFREEGDTTEPVGSIEIHSSDGLGAYMCNTGLRTVPEKKITLVAPEGKSFTDGNSILLTVYKKGEWMTIPARRGEPTAKFNCLTTTKWCDEYVDINKAYTQFNAWVGNESVNWQKSEDTIGDLVDGKLENNAAALEATAE